MAVHAVSPIGNASRGKVSMAAARALERPLYAQLKEALVEEVARGTFKPGDRIPSHRELCVRYHMSHMTVRRAITELVNEGVLHAVSGKGLYVSEPKQDADAGALTSFHDDMIRRGMTGDARTLESYMVSASTALAQIIGIEPGAPVAFMRRLFMANNKPIAISMAYLNYGLCPGILDRELVAGSLFATLRDIYGLRLSSGKRTAEAVLADPEQADLLGMQMPASLLLVEQLTFLDSGQAVEYGRMFFRGDRYRVQIK
jgi:GntR family transcriptional regulator